MWSTVVAERLGFITHAQAVARLDKTLGLARDDGAASAERPVLQLVRPHERRGPDRLAADRDPVVPILSSVDNGWLATGIHVVANAVPGAVRREPAPSSTACISASTTGRRSTGSRSTSPRAPASRLAATTRSSARAGSRATSGSPPANCPKRSTSAPGGRSRRPATGTGTRPSRSASARPISASTSSKGPTRTRTSESSRAGAEACSRR